jgi:hypothetical protein
VTGKEGVVVRRYCITDGGRWGHKKAVGVTLNLYNTTIAGDLTLGVDARMLVPDAHT